MRSLLLFVVATLITITGCSPRLRRAPTTPPLVVATAPSAPESPARRISWRTQVKVVDREARLWRRLPVVTMADDPAAAAFINTDVEIALGGSGYEDAPMLPSTERLEFGDARMDCTDTVATRDVLAFVCSGVSMGAHPYEMTEALAYDLRVGRVKRLTAQDLFTDAGVAHLKKLVAERATADAKARGVESPEVAERLDPIELHSEGLQVTYDRCSLGACIYGGTIVRVSCSDLAPWFRAESAWRC